MRQPMSPGPVPFDLFRRKSHPKTLRWDFGGMDGLHLPREAPAVNKKSAGHRIGDRPTASSAANAPNTPLTEAPVFDRPGCLLPASGLFGSAGLLG